ncbi:MAG: hypothetical protein KKB59_18720, partial [Spirochaetes bacterium]|nr:hypothetical protein [Spirochaetota bacterium]
YNAEKFANVYGRAAAAALSILQEERVLPAVTADDSPEGRALARLIVPGVTDAATLRYLLPPLIAHGRWAQQSAVSARNAHPFLDASGTRALALNGIFDGETEEEVQRYLTQVSQSPFRSENSSEYLALLWGHFYWVLSTDQWRFEGITARVDGEFEGFQVGSQSVDYPVYHQTRGVSHADLDQAAFREAVRAMVRRGGEVAAIGMSAISPGRLYVASHERPVFLVRRPDRDEFMVVSDTNAALGLFSESEVREARAAIEVLRQRAASRGADRAVSASEEADIRQRFQVEVLPLEGAGQLACVAPEFRRGILRRNVEVSNFDGAPSEREPFRTILDPVQTERDLYHSFYERHLNEIPERLSDLLEHYFPEGTRAPLLGFNERLIQRRFGPRLEALRRVVLVGTGSSHNLALAACAQLNRWMPEIEILALRPYEVLDVGREITPDRDLVVLLSWSSTTGDLVQFARELVSRQTAVVVIMEKGYADMALLARRSAGVILARTGEEVTVSSVKSGPCMLVVLYLLGLWLARQLGRNVEGGVARRRLSTAIEKIDRMLHDGLSHDFARALAEKAGPVDACTIVATDQGIARELSLKLEQNCWNVSSRILDYQDVDLIPESWDQTGQLVLVVATRREQLQEALDVMARLKERSIPFWAVTAGRSRWREVKVLSGGQCVSLPRAGDRFQPLLDGIFFTALAYDYSRALGWTEEVAPRNLTKSVTIAGSRPRAAESPSRELRRLQDLNEALRRHPREQPHGETAWEKDAGGTEEGKHYRQLRRIAEALAAKGEDLPAWLAPRQEVDWERLVIAVSDGISDRGEILVVCLDRASLATAQAVAPLFAPHLDRNVRVVPWR